MTFWHDIFFKPIGELKIMVASPEEMKQMMLMQTERIKAKQEEETQCRSLY